MERSALWPPSAAIKKTAVTAGVACALVACGFAGTLAYLTSTSGAHNTFVAVENEIEIVEDFVQPDELTWDMDITKDVRIENTGTATCYVRVLAEFSDPDAASHCSLDLNTVEWTEKQADGYYYLKSSLAPGETSPSLFTTVHVGSKPDAPSQSGPWVDYPDSFDVVVVAESVDVYGCDDPIQAFINHTDGVASASEDGE